jgi:hypothetical protein
MLNAHPQICLANEADLIPNLLGAGFKAADQLGLRDRIRFLSRYKRTVFGRRHLAALPPEAVRDFECRPGQLTFCETFESLLPTPGGVRIWGEKTLPLALYLPEVRVAYPNALCISLFRDPRAALLSLYRKRYHHGASGPVKLTKKAVSFFACQSMIWSEWARRARDARSEFGPDFVHELRFEDFVTGPEPALQQICLALGIGYDSSMLDKSPATIRRDGPA